MHWCKMRLCVQILQLLTEHNLDRQLYGSFSELTDESICLFWFVGSELELQQRKNILKCDPSEKGDIANTASHSSTSLSHRCFSPIAIKMAIVFLTAFYFYLFIYPIFPIILLHWYYTEEELMFVEGVRCSSSILIL